MSVAPVNRTVPAPAVKPAGAGNNETLFRLLLVMGSIVFFWVLIEFPALINLVDYEGLEYSQVWGSLRFIRVPDPQLLHIEPPYARYTGSSRGGDFEHAIRCAGKRSGFLSVGSEV